jgi:hypothetical protein
MFTLSCSAEGKGRKDNSSLVITKKLKANRFCVANVLFYILQNMKLL